MSISSRTRKNGPPEVEECWALVQYTEDLFLRVLLWKESWGTDIQSIHQVKWTDGQKYEAKLLAVGGQEEVSKAKMLYEENATAKLDVTKQLEMTAAKFKPTGDEGEPSPTACKTSHQPGTLLGAQSVDPPISEHGMEQSDEEEASCGDKEATASKTLRQPGTLPITEQEKEQSDEGASSGNKEATASKTVRQPGTLPITEQEMEQNDEEVATACKTLHQPNTLPITEQEMEQSDEEGASSGNKEATASKTVGQPGILPITEQEMEQSDEEGASSGNKEATASKTVGQPGILPITEQEMEQSDEEGATACKTLCQPDTLPITEQEMEQSDEEGASSGNKEATASKTLRQPGTLPITEQEMEQSDEEGASSSNKEATASKIVRQPGTLPITEQEMEQSDEEGASSSNKEATASKTVRQPGTLPITEQEMEQSDEEGASSGNKEATASKILRQPDTLPITEQEMEQSDEEGASSGNKEATASKTLRQPGTLHITEQEMEQSDEEGASSGDKEAAASKTSHQPGTLPISEYEMEQSGEDETPPKRRGVSVRASQQPGKHPRRKNNIQVSFDPPATEQDIYQSDEETSSYDTNHEDFNSSEDNYELDSYEDETSSSESEYLDVNSELDNSTDKLYDPGDLVEDRRCNKGQEISDKHEFESVIQSEAATSMSLRQHSDVQPSVKVATCNNKKGKRVWDRKAFCLYCCQEFSKLSKHMIARHSNETEVVQLCNSKKGSAERRNILKKLRNSGNHKHNDQVIKTALGILIPSRRPSHALPSANYTVCEVCSGYFLCHDFWRHESKCKGSSAGIKPGRTRRQGLSFMLMAVPDTCSDGLRTNVLPRMKVDNVSLVVKNDSLILAYGSKLYQKHIQETHLYVFISGKMRELGRFLLQARKESCNIKELQDCINVKNFPAIVVAVQAVCGFTSHDGKFQIPSLASKLGHALKYCAKIVEGRAMITGDEILQKLANTFTMMMELEWNSQISSAAFKTLYQAKWNTANASLPLAEDITRVHKFLNEELIKWTTTMQTEPSKCAWEKLASATLASIVLFNRRRSGEAQRLEISTYIDRSRTPQQTEVLRSLTVFEQKLTNVLTLLETRGKRGRKVPILLKEDARIAIDLLLQHRNVAGIHKDNKYIFALTNSGSLNPMRSDKVLRECASKCDAQSITSTKLRKHVASMTQLLNLKESELEILATFMGHDLKTHREYYRLPENTLQLAKVSKLLLAAEKGKMDRYKGLTLDEIDLGNMDSASEDEGSSTDSDASGFADTELATNCVNDADQGTAQMTSGPPNRTSSLSKLRPSRLIQADEIKETKSKDTTSNRQLHADKIPTQKFKHTKSKTSSTNQIKRAACSTRRKTNPVSWTEVESKFVCNFFKPKIVLGQVPGMTDVMNCKKAAGDLLETRSWVAIKSHVWNKIKKLGTNQ